MSIASSIPAIKGAAPEVVSAIQQASYKTGVDFSYLVDQARAESSFKADAKASTSSATGLYQFIDSTWLATLKTHGAQHGYGEQAAKIQQDFSGRYFVANDADKKAVMNLRTDPTAAALMAAEFAADNQMHLEQATGRDINSTDLYFAHFLGAGGASKFLSAMDRDPSQSAADLMPKAAAANKGVFYNKDGSDRSLEQVYAFFDKKFNGAETVQLADAKLQDAADNGYRVDPFFSKFYTKPVDDMMRRLPGALPMAKDESAFHSLFTMIDQTRMQHQLIDPVSLMMMAQMDLPL